MKRQEVEQIILNLNEIKKITDKQEYLVSSNVNQLYTKIIPILDKELVRMDQTKVDVNCPAIMILKYAPNKHTNESFTDIINKQIQELVMSDYKIIDYGVYENNLDTAYIKYTS